MGKDFIRTVLMADPIVNQIYIDNYLNDYRERDFDPNWGFVGVDVDTKINSFS